MVLALNCDRKVGCFLFGSSFFFHHNLVEWFVEDEKIKKKEEEEEDKIGKREKESCTNMGKQRFVREMEQSQKPKRKEKKENR